MQRNCSLDYPVNTFDVGRYFSACAYYGWNIWHIEITIGAYVMQGTETEHKVQFSSSRIWLTGLHLSTGCSFSNNCSSYNSADQVRRLKVDEYLLPTICYLLLPLRKPFVSCLKRAYF